MAKTGSKARFKMGEKKTGAVLLPKKFTTAKDAAAKGQRFSDLVDVYAKKAEKIDETNNLDVADTLDDVHNQSAETGYATRANATDSAHPLFKGDTLNMDDVAVQKLKKDLDMAQDNNNVLHEMAFSIRGDWLVENKLYNPDTHQIDQDKLKTAEQLIVPDLIKKGFPLPLGESEDDVVWFGVIHQDTDHLNMHLWMAKKSEETRPEMLKQLSNGEVEPIGKMNFRVKKAAEAKFRNNIEAYGNKIERAEILGRVDMRRQSIKQDALSLLDERPKYYEDLKRIYQVLPEELQGRWRVGNTDKLVVDDGSRMASANKEMNALVDRLLKTDLKEDYAAFTKDLAEVDKLMVKTHGEQNNDQMRWSESRDARLRKDLANGIYRQFNTNFKNHVDDNLKFTKHEHGQFETIRNHRKELSNKETHNQKSRTPVQTHHALSRISNSVVTESRKELQRTKAFLKEQERAERKTLNGDREASVDYIPNSDLKPNARHM